MNSSEKQWITLIAARDVSANHNFWWGLWHFIARWNCKIVLLGFLSFVAVWWNFNYFFTETWNVFIEWKIRNWVRGFCLKICQKFQFKFLSFKQITFNHFQSLILWYLHNLKFWNFEWNVLINLKFIFAWESKR